MHPQTVIEHFGTWNAAKRAAGLMPRRFATREELRRAAAAARRGARAHADCARHRRAARHDAVEVALLAHVRLAGDARCARRASTSRSARSGSSGRSSRAPRSRAQLGRLPRFGDWQAARRADPAMLTEWQVYRMFESRRGAWGTFQFLVRERLLEDGRDRRQPTARSAELDQLREQREAREAELALLRCAHRRQRIVLDVLDVGPEALLAGDRAVLERRAACPRAPRACAA